MSGRIRQSFCIGCFTRDGVTVSDAISRAAVIGYEAVELWHRDRTPFVELLEAAEANGLTVASMIGHDSLPDGLNKRSNHDRIEDELAESIAIASTHGIPGLICFSGNRDGLGDEKGVETTAEGLSRVSALAEKSGVNLNLELLNSKVDHPDYQCDRTLWGVQVCEQVGSPRVKLLYDIYHMQIMEGDLVRSIDDCGNWFGHYHTAGNPGRKDLDQEQEIHYPAVMKAIVESGYEGYVGHEFTPKGQPLAALEEAFRVCDYRK